MSSNGLPVQERTSGADAIATTERTLSGARSITEINGNLARLEEQEGSVTVSLRDLMSRQKQSSRELGRLDLLRAQLGSQAVAARRISNGVLADAAATALRISSAVKRLDLEQARVKETLDIVDQVAELKACVLGVTGSMGAAQDWETAAGYLHRASKIPKEIIDGPFAENIVPTSEVPDPPNVTLEQAAESLRGLFLREFEKAALENNGAKVTRFFKLFPLIGKSDDGLDVYGRYVCRGVATRARANLNAGTSGNYRKDGFFYANALTRLFEHIAQIIEHHGGLVERHYGPGRMLKVIERLQLEADVQGGIVVDTWCDERDIDRRLTDIKSYAFTFLVQSFMQTQQPRSGTPRANSPARRPSAPDNLARGEESLDMKDVDGFMSELAVMLARWSLYSIFVAAKCEDAASTSSGSKKLKMPALLENSSLHKKITDRLIAPFNIMTTFFFRRSVEKAFQLDEQPPSLTLNPAKSLASNPPYISSAVDDVLYIVNQVVERTLATSQRAVVSSIIPTIARVLGSDFIGMIQRRMRDECYPKSAIQGALPPEQTIIAFLVLMNNLDVATDYLKRIVQSRVETLNLQGNVEGNEALSAEVLAIRFPFEGDVDFVLSTLRSLQQSFESKSSDLINDGVLVMFKNVFKPRLRPILAEAFRDMDYQMTDDRADGDGKEADEVELESQGIEVAVQNQFQRSWDALTKPVARILTERNFQRLLATIVSYLGEVLEKRIWSYFGRLTEVGAVRLERDIASIISIVVKGARYGLRDAFARCTQICLVMNMEEDEWDELQSTQIRETAEEGDWQIDTEERARARAMVPVR